MADDKENLRTGKRRLQEWPQSRRRADEMRRFQARLKLAETIAEQRIKGLPDKYKHAYARNAGFFRA